jgi:hypothetical protein
MYRPRVEGIDKDFANDHIRSCIEDYDQRLMTDEAHVSLIRDKIIAAIESGKAPYFRFDRPDHILPAVKAANLPRKPEFEQALATAWARSSFLRSMAGDKAVWEQFLVEGHLDLFSANTYAAIIADLGKKQGWELSARAAEAAERERSIKNILGVA